MDYTVDERVECPADCETDSETRREDEMCQLSPAGPHPEHRQRYVSYTESIYGMRYHCTSPHESLPL
jgi:hypothetical protein